jgi:hypothetical protein
MQFGQHMSSFSALSQYDRSPFGMTWALWQRLSQPMAHPVFRRTITVTDRHFSGTFVSMMAVLNGMVLCATLSSVRQLAQSSNPALGFIVMTIFSSGYVVIWVMQIAGGIVREHEHGRYDLLCLSPYGALHTHLAIGAAYLHQQDALERISLLRLGLACLMFFMLLVATLVTATQVQSSVMPQCLTLILEIMLLAGCVYYDHIQTTVLGSLVGMLVPVYGKINRAAALAGSGLFLLLQSLTLLVTLVLLHVFSQYFSGAFNPTVLGLLVFFIPREIVIRGVWRTLVYALNAPAEQTSIIASEM